MNIKELAIQCGIQHAIDNSYLNEELNQFAQAVIAEFVKKQKPVALEQGLLDIIEGCNVSGLIEVEHLVDLLNEVKP